jgi:hypothetical protein
MILDHRFGRLRFRDLEFLSLWRAPAASGVRRKSWA